MLRRMLRLGILIPFLLVLPLIIQNPIRVAATSNSYSVSIVNLSFSPSTLFIKRGGAVTWTNNDQVIHQLWLVDASDNSTIALSDPISPGGTFTMSFSSPLKITYYDFNRLWITGDIVIFLYDADANGDGVIDQADVDLVSSLVGSTYTNCSTPAAQIICHADVNHDLKVDSTDVSITKSMSIVGPIPSDPDANGDGKVDLNDLILVWQNEFSATCPFAQPYKAHYDANNDCKIDLNDLIFVWQSEFSPYPP